MISIINRICRHVNTNICTMGNGGVLIFRAWLYNKIYLFTILIW